MPMFVTPRERRGLAKKGGDGKAEIIAKDNPWAEDGKLIWDALEEYASGYVVRASFPQSFEVLEKASSRMYMRSRTVERENLGPALVWLL